MNLLHIDIVLYTGGSTEGGTSDQILEWVLKPGTQGSGSWRQLGTLQSVRRYHAVGVVKIKTTKIKRNCKKY